MIHGTSGTSKVLVGAVLTFGMALAPRVGAPQSLTIQPPQNGIALISGTGFPADCQSSTLIAIRGGVFSNRIILGALNTLSDGSWGPFGFNFPPEVDTATDYYWESDGSCLGSALRGANPGSAFPKTVAMAPFDIGTVEPSITIQPPDFRSAQIVRGSGLPQNAFFLLFLAGVPTNSGQTDPSGSFAFNFEVTQVPNVFPRPVGVDFSVPPLPPGPVFTGTEADGPYPHTVALAPSGSLILEEIRSQTSAVIFGAGFPRNCESSVLFAVANATRVPLGGFNTPANGSWAFNFNFPPEAQTATEFVWEGFGSCAGSTLMGSNPGGPYPRVVPMSDGQERQAHVDVKPGACPNPVNVRSRGVLPVAIVGGPDLDVRQLDPGSIRLMGLAPIRTGLEDVATPYLGSPTHASDCTTEGADGTLDLTMKFDLLALGIGGFDGMVQALPLTGRLKSEFGGGSIEGRDVVVILDKTQNH